MELHQEATVSEPPGCGMGYLQSIKMLIQIIVYLPDYQTLQWPKAHLLKEAHHLQTLAFLALVLISFLARLWY